jgi:hypothetical protein
MWLFDSLTSSSMPQPVDAPSRVISLAATNSEHSPRE